MANNAGLKDILEEGKKLFFPDRISPQGSESDFEFEVWDCLTNDKCLSIGTMYEAARLTMLRFYVATKPKEHDDDTSETSEVILVSASGGSEITSTELQLGDVMVDFNGVQPALEMSVISEVTLWSPSRR